MPLPPVLHIDAFTDTPGMGNPAGVVPDAGGLSDEEMQAVARAVGFNETVFVHPSDKADYRFRFFTPGHEMNLCGHATVAAMSLIGQARELTIETRAGVLPVSHDAESGMVTMRQAAPEFAPFGGDRKALAEAMGADAGDIRTDIPVLYGSTGTWTLLVPATSEEALLAMKPHNDLFPAVLAEMPRASVHPFVWEPDLPDRDFNARHFSSPFSGTVEDPVTGTASGVMGAYALRHLTRAASGNFIVAQGKSVGRDGRVHVRVEGDKVWISGKAAVVGEIEL